MINWLWTFWGASFWLTDVVNWINLTRILRVLNKLLGNRLKSTLYVFLTRKQKPVATHLGLNPHSTQKANFSKKIRKFLLYRSSPQSTINSLNDIKWVSQKTTQTKLKHFFLSCSNDGLLLAPKKIEREKKTENDKVNK